MISIDTNVIVRFLTKDDEKQYKKAYTLIDSNDVYVPDTVILETEWVLRYAYEFSPKEICEGLEYFFGLKNVKLTNAQIVFTAITWCRKGMDFADAFHLALSQQFEAFATFDKKFIKKATLTETSTKVILP
ncbi:MAG: type II toxin-antitoxin system VapC family toxin [Planctomycetes bacterium]|nr:type II toxin-antitoxin system VapC family toxin [Planctomycetota bacterium]